MAEQEQAASESVHLDTVDLKTPTDMTSKPVLEFQSQAVSTSNSTIPLQASAAVDSPVEGTELQSRPRAKSGTSFKDWSTHQIKVSKQLFSERFGHGIRTVDSQLETRIEALKETQKKYAHLIALSIQFGNHFSQVLETQRAMAEHFAFMSVRAPELHTEFRCNSDSQKALAKNGEKLLGAARLFSSSMQTVCSTTMEDTLMTVKEYDAVRLTYDAYRNELEALRKQANTSLKAAERVPAATADFEKKKARFEQLRNDVDIKLKLLDENKVSYYCVDMLQDHIIRNVVYLSLVCCHAVS